MMQDDSSCMEEVASLVQTLLLEKAPMLEACFGLRVNKDAQLCALPQLIEGYIPTLDFLPQFVLSLARDIDWESEQECFSGVAEVIFFCSWRGMLVCQIHVPK